MTEKERWQNVMRQMRVEPLTLSPKISATMRNSLAGMLMILARYKFGIKMMQNRSNMKIIDLGCNDGIGDLMIKQNVDCETILGVDFDSEAITWAKDNIEDDVLQFVEADFLDKSFELRGGGGCHYLVGCYRTYPEGKGNSFSRYGIC